MSRTARVKNEGYETVYHLCGRVSGGKGYYPFQKSENNVQFMKLLKFYSKNYSCELLSYCLMGNHFHMIVKFLKPEKLSRTALTARAREFYPNSEYYLSRWNDKKWAQFEKRLFDVSEFMRSFNQAFTNWFNKTNNRRGSFWSDRFKSTILDTPQAIQECMLYVDLNPVRAGLVDKPEDYELSSCYIRVIEKDDFLVDLKKLFPTNSKKMSLRVYLQVLYLRGSLPQEDNKRRIPEDVYEKAVKREFRPEGIYRKKLKYFVNGVVISSKSKLNEKIEYLNSKLPKPYFKKRSEGVSHVTGDYTLNNQH